MIQADFLEHLQDALKYADEIRQELFSFKDYDLEAILIGPEEVEIQYTSGSGFSSHNSEFHFPVSYLCMTLEEIRAAEREKERKSKEQSRIWEEERKQEEIKRLKEWIPACDKTKAAYQNKLKELIGEDYKE